MSFSRDAIERVVRTVVQAAVGGGAMTARSAMSARIASSSQVLIL